MKGTLSNSEYQKLEIGLTTLAAQQFHRIARLSLSAEAKTTKNLQ